MIICGVDDAGRGSMIGPLVISGVTIDKKNVKKLRSIGVQDSKKLSPKTIIIFGGPNYPVIEWEQESWLKKYDHIDFYMV